MVIKITMCNVCAPYAIAILKAVLVMMYYPLVFVLLKGCAPTIKIAFYTASAFVALETPLLDQNSLTKVVDSVAISAHNDLNE